MKKTVEKKTEGKKKAGKKTVKSIADIIIEKRFYGEGKLVLEKILSWGKQHKKINEKLSLKELYENTSRKGKTSIRYNGHLTWVKSNLKGTGITISPEGRDKANKDLVETILVKR